MINKNSINNKSLLNIDKSVSSKISNESTKTIDSNSNLDSKSTTITTNIDSKIYSIFEKANKIVVVDNSIIKARTSTSIIKNPEVSVKFDKTTIDLDGIASEFLSKEITREQYSSKEIADMLDATLSFDDDSFTEPIKNALYTRPLKSGEFKLSSDLDIMADPFNFALNFISSKKASELYDINDETYGILYKFVKDKYIEPNKNIINISMPASRVYSLQDYMVTPIVSYYGAPISVMRTPENRSVSSRDIILKYEEILYGLSTSLTTKINEISSPFLKELIVPFIIEDPKKLSSNREYSKYSNNLLLNLDKSVIYGDSRDKLLLSILNSSYNKFLDADLELNIDYFSKKIALDSISYYNDYFNEKGDDLRSALSNLINTITLNPIKYTIEYYYSDTSKSEPDKFFIDNIDVSNLVKSSEWNYVAIKNSGVYYRDFVKTSDGNTLYKSKIYVKNILNGSYVETIPPSEIDLNNIIANNEEVCVKVLSNISVEIKDGYIVDYKLSTDKVKYIISFENLTKNFFDILFDCYNNSVLDVTKLADGYGTYSPYLDLLKMVASDDYCFDSLNKLKLSEFVYILKDFYKIKNSDPYIISLRGKLSSYYSDCSKVRTLYKEILDEFRKNSEYFSCIKL